MPKIGDYVIIEGTKVGAVRREGNLVGIVGSLLKVQWIDGTESVISPGAGSIKIEPRAGSSKSSKKTPAGKKAQKKKSGGKKR
ncbi:MAG TPA: hypothetical protein VGW79_04885 [Actinomycetota bacterium]|nr:hypothetical protein [Actinomycetota bacterium]